jgi:hypothetical protein
MLRLLSEIVVNNGSSFQNFDDEKPIFWKCSVALKTIEVVYLGLLVNYRRKPLSL